MITEPKFFRKENNSDHAAEFKRCLPVNVNTSFVTLAPAIATAELQYLKPYLGAPLFDHLADYYETYGTSGDSDATNTLVELVQMAVVRLAYWDSFDQLAVMMSDSGLSDKNGENRAYRYQADALRNSLWRQGYAYLNQIVRHCEANIEELWQFEQSDYYTLCNKSVIRSLVDFDAHARIDGDFAVFAKLRPYISQTEAMELPYRLGNTLATDITTDRDNTRFDTIRTAVMGFVAHWSMAEAVPFLGFTVTPQGLVVYSEESRNGGAVANPPSDQQLAALTDRHRSMAERYIGQVVTFCKQHLDLFPEITEIGTNTDHEKSASHRPNRGKKTFMA